AVPLSGFYPFGLPLSSGSAHRDRTPGRGRRPPCHRVRSICDPFPMSITLTDARIVTPDEVHEGWLTIENGRITHVGRGKAPGEGHSLSGGYVVPGFVDIHSHGGDGGSYPEGDLDGARRAAALHARHGTTTT